MTAPIQTAEQLAPCPWCGQRGVPIAGASREIYYGCDNEFCPATPCCASPEEWNAPSRHTAEAVRSARRQALQEAIDLMPAGGTGWGWKAAVEDYQNAIRLLQSDGKDKIT